MDDPSAMRLVERVSDLNAVLERLVQWLCNTNKGAGDDTDFRAIREGHALREKGCVFCGLDERRVLASNTLAVAIHDGHPVTPLHSLMIPRRHVADYFGLVVDRSAAFGDVGRWGLRGKYRRRLGGARFHIDYWSPACCCGNRGANPSASACERKKEDCPGVDLRTLVS